MNGTEIWLWSWHNSYINYTNWTPGKGKPGTNSCISSNIHNALWNAVECNTAKPFVCQISAVVDVCDPEWSYFNGTNQNGMCYKYMSEPKVTFLTAQSICANHNANLVSIHSKEENDFVSSLTAVGVPNLDYHYDTVFIGLQYANGGWKWLDGTHLDFENWAPNRPYYPGSTNGAFLCPDISEKWDDNTLDFQANRFVCKKKPNFMFVSENSS
uniref:C-type lectin domain-containing protein n=1 Tax=Panagrolaimus sp. JU765 TaxID=591449 RepID=A0AC34Q6Z9_9BILA